MMDLLSRKKYVKDFGVLFSAKVFLLQSLMKVCRDNQKIVLSDMVNEMKIKKLETEYARFIKEKALEWRENFSTEIENRVVWNFWYQGNHREIEMVKLCMDSIEKNLPSNSTMITVTRDNLEKYVKLPEHIKCKFDDGIISTTLLSDIVRMLLISEYGGCWLDATMYGTNDFSYVFEKSFWTIKRDVNNLYIAKGRWAIYAFQAYKGSVVPVLMKDLLVEYWKNHDVPIDFFMTDLFIELLYRIVPEARGVIDEVSYNNQNVQELWPKLSETFSEKKYQDIVQNTQLHKLSWRIATKVSQDNALTIFGELLRRNELK